MDPLKCGGKNKNGSPSTGGESKQLSNEIACLYIPKNTPHFSEFEKTKENKASKMLAEAIRKRKTSTSMVLQLIWRLFWYQYFGCFVRLFA